MHGGGVETCTVVAQFNVGIAPVGMAALPGGKITIATSEKTIMAHRANIERREPFADTATDRRPWKAGVATREARLGAFLIDEVVIA
jgi:hypothetical protein